MKKPPRTLRSDEVAARLNVSVAKVYRLVRDGVLKARKQGYASRISEESVQKYLGEQSRRGR